jgi:hypothetical protein
MVTILATAAPPLPTATPPPTTSMIVKDLSGLFDFSFAIMVSWCGGPAGLKHSCAEQVAKPVGDMLGDGQGGRRSRGGRVAYQGNLSAPLDHEVLDQAAPSIQGLGAHA